VLFSDRFIVAMADVDAAGIIYFGSPVRWAERMYTTWVRALGHPTRMMFSEGIATPAVNLGVNYRSHINLDDECRLDLTAAKIGTTSFTLRCECFVGDADTAAVEVRTTHVYARFMHPSYTEAAHTEKQPLPDWLRTSLEAGYRDDVALTAPPR
jgi:acyl-CoA thioester hydrolase